MNLMNYNIQQWLPTTKKEVEQRGWNSIDVILFSGDAYVDHPSFGAAVIGRLLESLGLKVAIVPQPNWQDDLRDFKKLGKPNLFFGISPGCMDSMVNHYTVSRKHRQKDSYSPGQCLHNCSPLIFRTLRLPTFFVFGQIIILSNLNSAFSLYL